MSKYGVIFGPSFPVFGLNTEIYEVDLRRFPNTGKYGPEITPYLDTFCAVAITHEMFEAFVCNPSPEVRLVFSDISKAFDNVWHEDLLYKIKSMGISGELYSLPESYLSGTLQRVVLNGQTLSWGPVLVGVPQGSILDSYIFLIYINDFPNEVKSNMKLFADDTSLFTLLRIKMKVLVLSIMT